MKVVVNSFKGRTDYYRDDDGSRCVISEEEAAGLFLDGVEVDWSELEPSSVSSCQVSFDIVVSQLKYQRGTSSFVVKGSSELDVQEQVPVADSKPGEHVVKPAKKRVSVKSIGSGVDVKGGYVALWLRPEDYIRLVKLVLYSKFPGSGIRLSTKTKAFRACLDEFIENHCPNFDKLF